MNSAIRSAAGAAAAREHEEVRQLTRSDLEPRQRSRLGAESVQLFTHRQPLDQWPRQVAQSLKDMDDLRERLGGRLTGCVANHIGTQRLFVRIADTREIGDLAGERLSIKTLGITLGQRFDRATHVNLDEA